MFHCRTRLIVGVLVILLAGSAVFPRIGVAEQDADYSASLAFDALPSFLGFYLDGEDETDFDSLSADMQRYGLRLIEGETTVWEKTDSEGIVRALDGTYFNLGWTVHYFPRVPALLAEPVLEMLLRDALKIRLDATDLVQGQVDITFEKTTRTTSGRVVTRWESVGLKGSAVTRRTKIIQ